MFFLVLKNERKPIVSIVKKYKDEWRLVGQHEDIVEATEMKLSMRKTHKEWKKKLGKWTRHLDKLRAKKYSPAFSAFMRQTIDSHMKARPKHPFMAETCLTIKETA